MKHIKNILKCAIFLLILGSSLLVINSFFEPKFIIKNCEWPSTASYAQFYEMEENSVDVLFLGSSLVVNAIIPQEIYNEYGIRSFNLGSDQQSVILSYYWLKEALRFQKPKVVFFESRFLRCVHPENPINTVEGLTRKCIDPMKWSEVKREAVKEICEIDTSQSELSYYLTNIRFHTRWTDLKEYDFDRNMVDTPGLKGYGPIFAEGDSEFNIFYPEDSTVVEEFDPLMEEYLDRMVKLCKDNDITLVLFDCPNWEMNDARNNVRVRYAEKNGIDYYNLCLEEYYNQIGAELPEENVVGHQNIWGAIKTSRFIGNILAEKYGVKPVKDEQYENTNDYYEQVLGDGQLGKIKDQKEYLAAINNPNYAVFIVGQGDISEFVKIDAVYEGFENLGLKQVSNIEKEASYVAAVVEGKVVAEEMSTSAIWYANSFRNRRSVFIMNSFGENKEGYSSISIEGAEAGRCVHGINITVYDLCTYKVIDRVTFYGESVIR